MALAICQHIKLGGRRCGSPSLRGQRYCYFHASADRAVPSVNLWPNPEARTLEIAHRKDPLSFELRNEAMAIQFGYTRLIAGLWHGLLNVRQVKLILNELHEAAGLRGHIATEDSAVTSNQLQLPIPRGYPAAASETRGD